jgi:hypothetical protein
LRGNNGLGTGCIDTPGSHDWRTAPSDAALNWHVRQIRVKYTLNIHDADQARGNNCLGKPETTATNPAF